MFNYSKQIESFRDKKVRLTSTMKDMLRMRRKRNRDKLKSDISEELPNVSLSDSSFQPQGSFAMQTIIQTKFDEEGYDIDDGVIVNQDQLKDDDGNDLPTSKVREAFRKTLEDNRFKKQPTLCMNCVRVFYADTDEKKHHIDFPIYRKRKEGDEVIQEIASKDKWMESNPTQVNQWLDKLVEDRNAEEDQWGTQFRRHIQLLKRFCRSREDWGELLPNGMKLTMLVDECLPAYNTRIDEAFRQLLRNISARLEDSYVIVNRAHPDQPDLTRSDKDENVVALEEKVNEALEHLEALDKDEKNTVTTARQAWDWVFQTDGYFESLDDDTVKKSASETRSLAIRPYAPWQELPLWPIQSSFSLTVSGRYSRDGTSWHRFESGQTIEKNVKLRFNAHTSAATPYKVYWQIVNSGREAINADCLRGELIASTTEGVGGLHSTTAKDMMRDETTAYSGTHWVECYLVRNGAVIARSNSFLVEIR